MFFLPLGDIRKRIKSQWGFFLLLSLFFFLCCICLVSAQHKTCVSVSQSQSLRKVILYCMKRVCSLCFCGGRSSRMTLGSQPVSIRSALLCQSPAKLWHSWPDESVGEDENIPCKFCWKTTELVLVLSRSEMGGCEVGLPPYVEWKQKPLLSGGWGRHHSSPHHHRGQRYQSACPNATEPDLWACSGSVPQWNGRMWGQADCVSHPLYVE